MLLLCQTKVKTQFHRRNPTVHTLRCELDTRAGEYRIYKTHGHPGAGDCNHGDNSNSVSSGGERCVVLIIWQEIWRLHPQTPRKWQRDHHHRGRWAFWLIGSQFELDSVWDHQRPAGWGCVGALSDHTLSNKCGPSFTNFCHCCSVFPSVKFFGVDEKRIWSFVASSFQARYDSERDAPNPNVRTHGLSYAFSRNY